MINKIAISKVGTFELTATICLLAALLAGRSGFANELARSTIVETASADPRPNIVVIFADDHAQHAVSCYGSNINQTPHLDALAKRGVRFGNSFVTNSICTPSRATLLTGQYSHLNGVPVFNAFDGSRNHVAKLLQLAGYHTGVVGKWHLGSDPTGFDRWIVLPGQGRYVNPEFLVSDARLSVIGHCTNVTTDLAMEWVRTRPKNRPFFLLFNQKAPHRNWQPDAANRQKFANKTFPFPPTFRDEYKTRPAALPANQQTIARDLTRSDLKLTPPPGLSDWELDQWLAVSPDEVTVAGRVLRGDALLQWKYDRYMQDYLACVQGIDDNVGRFVEFLDREGLTANTVVIYTSDNGWYLGDLGLYDKRFMYEPGLRVPLIAAGPGITAAKVSDQLVANIDLAPTFLEVAGLPVPDWMQGRSLAPLLRGEMPTDWRTSIYYRYYHDPGHHNTAAHFGVRTATHKLIHYWNKDAWELFDLVVDPHEQHNLLFAPADASRLDVSQQFQDLKAEIERLQILYKDNGQFADPSTWPKSSADGPFNKTPRGTLTVNEAIRLSTSQSSNISR